MEAPPRPERPVRSVAHEPFMQVIRELARTYQAFMLIDAGYLREDDLTVPQADVIFTLGNTDGMTFGELGERTLITKGTLTGVVDRLERKGLVRRAPHAGDARCTLAVLTPAGQELFERVFPKHADRLRERLEALSRERLLEIRDGLRELQKAF